MPRFVILFHETPPASERPSHYDLMFEQGEALRTWAAQQLPSADSDTQAVELAPHRLAYLDYEGVVSNQRGHVRRWDHGEYSLFQDTPQRWVVQVLGQHWSGTLSLEHEHQTTWRLRFTPGTA